MSNSAGCCHEQQSKIFLPFPCRSRPFLPLALIPQRRRLSVLYILRLLFPFWHLQVVLLLFLLFLSASFLSFIQRIHTDDLALEMRRRRRRRRALKRRERRSETASSRIACSTQIHTHTHTGRSRRWVSHLNAQPTMTIRSEGGEMRVRVSNSCQRDKVFYLSHVHSFIRLFFSRKEEEKGEKE